MRNVNLYLMKVFLILIIIHQLILFNVVKSSNYVEHDIVVEESPKTITLRWTTNVEEENYNLSVKEYGKLNYKTLFVRENVTFYTFRRPYKCFSGEFLLESKNAVRTAFVKPKLPNKVTIENFIIVYNWYDEITSEITVNLKWSNDKLKNWTNVEVKQIADVHLIECGEGVNSKPPQFEFTSTTSGQLILPAEYANALARSSQTNPKCLLLITIVSPIRICDMPIVIQERADQTSSAMNSVVVNVDCDSTGSLPCLKIAPTAGPGVFVPSPKCDPNNITARWLSETKLQIEWSFETTKDNSIRRYAIRYGKVNQKSTPTTSESLLMPMLDIFASMDVELGRLKTSDNETNIVIAIENNNLNAYKISICALYDGNSDGDIMWNIVPTYNIQRRKKLQKEN